MSAEMVGYRFGVPKDPTDEMVSIYVWKDDAWIRFDFRDTEEGVRSLDLAMRAIPAVIAEVRSEKTVVREVASIDQDLTDLLGDDQ